jgi:hypothetical protein
VAVNAGRAIMNSEIDRLFKHAIFRTPGSNFDAGLTTVSLGRPEFAKVLEIE